MAAANLDTGIAELAPCTQAAASMLVMLLARYDNSLANERSLSVSARSAGFPTKIPS
ncbi:Uncharacterised protein [Mycobacteroides abscessus subsp. massiliense]|nr:Uncharacterised protein [Mycobacteroides abscessus subsp. massiliense]SLB07301.1 Uncharacterised protein [Mycobacteroides abscessus subsp. massiliense]